MTITKGMIQGSNLVAAIFSFNISLELKLRYFDNKNWDKSILYIMYSEQL